jgi:hypothetical protein
LRRVCAQINVEIVRRSDVGKFLVEARCGQKGCTCHRRRTLRPAPVVAMHLKSFKQQKAFSIRYPPLNSFLLKR